MAEDEEFFDTRGVWVRGVELEGGEGETEGEFDDVDRVAAGGEVARWKWEEYGVRRPGHERVDERELTGIDGV